MVKEPLEVLRALAKNDYYQSLYSCAKELGLQMFENTTDLTKLQLWFLSYASMYSVISTDIVMGECPERVLDNTIFEDAYMQYKRVSSNKDIKKKVTSIKLPKKQQETGTQITPKSSWVFKRKQKHD